MRNHTILISLLASLTASGCQAVECAEGTVERDGMCMPEDKKADDARCGAFTHLEGDRCVPDFPPTVCESGTTEAEPDPVTGVTTCKGTGGGDCNSSIACPTPTGATKQTICGQLYDFETGAKLQAMMPNPNACNPAMPATSGPCALQIGAFDAIAFATNPTVATPLPVGSVTIDECGRFRLQDIETNGTGPFIGLGVDDAGMPFSASGVSVTAAVATPKQGMFATKDLEAFIVKPSTAAGWTSSGGPPLSGGIYATVFRAHKLPVTSGTVFDPQPGVTVTKSGNTVPSNDFYFQAAETNRTTIDAAATMTGANGTALITGASVADSVAWGGQGGLGQGCRWEPHAGASLSNFGGIVFIQVFRKIDIVGQTCND